MNTATTHKIKEGIEVLERMWRQYLECETKHERDIYSRFVDSAISNMKEILDEQESG